MYKMHTFQCNFRVWITVDLLDGDMIRNLSKIMSYLFSVYFYQGLLKLMHWERKELMPQLVSSQGKE